MAALFCGGHFRLLPMKVSTLLACEAKPILPRINAPKPQLGSKKSLTTAELWGTTSSVHSRIPKIGKAYTMQGDTVKAKRPIRIS